MLSSSVVNPEKSRRLISSREHRGHHIHYSKQRIRMAPPHGHCSSDLRVDWEVELASCQGFFLTIRLSRCLLKNTFLMFWWQMTSVGVTKLPSWRNWPFQGSSSSTFISWHLHFFRRIEHLEALSPSMTLRTEGCQQMSKRQFQRWVVYMSTRSIVIFLGKQTYWQHAMLPTSSQGRQ